MQLLVFVELRYLAVSAFLEIGDHLVGEFILRLWASRAPAIPTRVKNDLLFDIVERGSITGKHV